ncbi:MAG: polyribonucleotide nucleotidyltransferase [candidate division KSB1 bacterium]|nr:polyribonucleotide nucleotidyltransferase [candidate division KSB1 bacterium]
MIITKEIKLNEFTYSLEHGRVAKQASGAVLVRFGDTVVLATVVGSDEPSAQDFFPLSVDYREKAYAAGKIPGGFFKREGRPSENEILSSRLIDRSLRPLFPEGYRNEVQVMVTVLSADKENDPDVLGITGASAALTISDIPWDGPVAGIRVGRVNGKFIANPTYDQLEVSDLDLVITANEESIIMVEGESWEISEADMLAALEFGHQQAQPLIQMQKELQQEIGKEKLQVAVPELPEGLEDKVRSMATDKIRELLNITEKKDRRTQLKEHYAQVVESLQETYPESEADIKEVLHKIEKELTRKMILDESRRLDGRGMDDIRDITCEVGLLPRTHGSCLFTRGQTQALAVITLGTKIDEQKMDELEGEFFKSYMLHYNFPPFSVGEIRPLRGPGRREIGHGFLAERALKPVIPAEEIFPYTIRIVSDILESNGSSSMATVCAGSLALMDAGVPTKDQVAGIAMGLVTDGDNYKILTDILGDEDHLGDMDFKVAGTKNGITAFQMDIKIKGMKMQIMQEALEKARQARLKILDVMNRTLHEPRHELSKYAPRIISFKINPEYIGAIIGPGGKIIRDIVDKTGATIDISDDGTVKIASVEPRAGLMAKNIIEELAEAPEIGKVYKGKVKKITNFGAFVEILPGKEGLLHISEIEPFRINRVEDVLNVGDEVLVKLIRIDDSGKLNLSRKAAMYDSEKPSLARHKSDSRRR